MFLTVSQVEDELARRGNKMTTVTFAKKDGEVTTRAGLPKVFTRRIDHEKADGAAIARSNAATQALKNNGNHFVDYVNPDKRIDGKRGFSFNKGRVFAIGDVGTHPS